MNVQQIAAWLEAHPVIVAQVLIPLATAIFTWLLKPRTQEEYEKMGPRLAGLHKIVAGLGIDAPKLVDGLMLLLLKKRSSRSIAPLPLRDTPVDPVIPMCVDVPAPPPTKPEV